MDDAFGAADSFDGALTRDERAALAAWAEHDASDGFADSVLAAWAATRVARDEMDEMDEDLLVSHAPWTSAAGARRLGRRSSGTRGAGVRGIIGLGAAIAAAAAVMLMVRVIPRDAGSLAVAHDCEHARSSAALDPEAGALGVDADSVSSQADSVLGADAMAVLTAHCSPCHDGAAAEASPGALGVFDLQQSQWWWQMTDDQLREASLRVDELGSATDEERRSVAAFVGAELVRRAHAG